MGQAQSDEYQCHDGGWPKKSSSSSSSSAGDEKTGAASWRRRDDSRRKSHDTAKLNEQHVRKLSSVSNRNIQLLSMKPRGEKDVYADDLRTRRRSSLINLILGAPSGGPKFSDDIRSLSSHVSNFGIEYFPDVGQRDNSLASSIHRGLDNPDELERGGPTERPGQHQKRRRSSLGSQLVDIDQPGAQRRPSIVPSPNRPMLANTLASIDLTSSFDLHDKPGSLFAIKPAILEETTPPLSPAEALKIRTSKGRLNTSGRVLRRCGSELSLYSDGSTPTSGSASTRTSTTLPLKPSVQAASDLDETKLIIILQVCLPFMLAGFGNMAAGLALHKVSQWPVFEQMPIFFILLPPFVGLKGNIEMTLASRLSTLSNLNLLRTKHQWARAYLSNTVLTLGQGMGLSSFAAILSAICYLSLNSDQATHSLVGGLKLLEMILLVVLASSLVVSVLTTLLSGLIVPFSVRLANIIRVNPDNFSTLFAALYGDVSCVLIYAFVADWMMSLNEHSHIICPIIVLSTALLIWPTLMFTACRLKETQSIAISSILPMIFSILVSMASGSILSMFINRFRLVALYQPVVNGFGANLIAVQASRVSTWLWCSALKKVTGFEGDSNTEDPKKLGTLTTFTQPVKLLESSNQSKQVSIGKRMGKTLRRLFWSFNNPSPNSLAARLLLIMQIPAHTIYFLVIWLLIGPDQINLSWKFYLVYMCLCLVQISILLTICEPLMTLLMSHHLDPDIFGISLLMSIADLIGTLCLVGAFHLLEYMNDSNALK